MPMEGPLVRIVSERLCGFKGRKVVKSFGNAKIDVSRMSSAVIRDIFSRGKQLIIAFPGFNLRIHFMMYGSWRINAERPGVVPRLGLDFETGMLRFYNCSVRIIDGDLTGRAFDPEIDITGENWNRDKVLSLALEKTGDPICDVLMDQEVFAGVGNMIKNEALFDARIHPMSIVASIPRKSLSDLAEKTREFSMRLYEVENAGRSFADLFRVYRRPRCPVSGDKVVMKSTGERDRVSFFCPKCQILYR